MVSVETSPARARILVVDDDSDVRDSTCALLDAFGYEAVEAASITGALRSVLGDPPDLIFTGIRMPDGDGYALLRVLKEHRIAIPVIACSAGDYGMDTDPLAKALALGAVAAIEKPFFADGLQGLIVKALASRQR